MEHILSEVTNNNNKSNNSKLTFLYCNGILFAEPQGWRGTQFEKQCFSITPSISRIRVKNGNSSASRKS